MSQVSKSVSGPGVRRYFLGAPFDRINGAEVVEAIANVRSGTRFRYVVTPNVDHVVRLNQNRNLKTYYDEAWMTLCDSRPIAMFGRAMSVDLPHVTGSDLTVSLFQSVLQDGDVITLIVATDNIACAVQAAYPNVRFRVLVPPEGVSQSPDALQACVDFAALEEARFVFIAIGSPQSEKIAYELAMRPEARGVGLCVGAALEFLVGAKKRAPRWMRRAGLEWAHRMASDPKRLWRRYLYSALPLLRLFSIEVSGRQRRAGDLTSTSSR
jgi:exopolysaccharide biosynthesis WecB/TagA/CpsF family protein